MILYLVGRNRPKEGNVRTTISNDRVITVKAKPTLASRIEAGRYRLVYTGIQENFVVESISTSYKSKMVVVYFGRSISAEEAIKEMAIKNLRPANTAESLAYGEAVALAMRQFDFESPPYWLACLGSVAMIDGVRHVLGLGRWDGGWNLYHRRWVGDWPSDFRFLAVR